MVSIERSVIISTPHHPQQFGAGMPWFFTDWWCYFLTGGRRQPIHNYRASSKALAPSSQPLHLPTAPRGKGMMSRPPVLAST